MTTPMSSLAVWPGFATKKKDTQTRKSWGDNDKWLTTNGGVFVNGVTPDFQISEEVVAADAKVYSQMWLKHPAYKVTLASSQKDADKDGDGMIDQNEFDTLMASSGFTGSNTAALFASIDADGGKPLVLSSSMAIVRAASTRERKSAGSPA